jgi:hypothetical protein
MLLASSVAAATAVVGFDLFQSNSAATIAPGQRVTFGAVLGSAAAGDSEIRLMAGNTHIATLFNSNTGFPTGTDMFPVAYRHVGPTTRIYATVVNAPATNPINISVVREG